MPCYQKAAGGKPVGPPNTEFKGCVSCGLLLLAALVLVAFLSPLVEHYALLWVG